ncbi:uncharacterized protein [Clinocottus analis]|uniref:uncharacterized protein n=1 Tax=Clinocottus analis TaxID=304258 RepID=UPI0035BF97A4
MASVGVEVSGSWLPASGAVGFFVALLLLSIFLTALCSECSRRSFELKDSQADKDPSALIKVVKLQEAVQERENPALDLKEETDFQPSKGDTVSFIPWRRHLEAPPNHSDTPAGAGEAVNDSVIHPESPEESNPEEESPAPFTLWRTHLKPEENFSIATDNLYHSIGGGGSSGHAPSTLTNHGPGEEPGDRPAAPGSVDVNSLYAQLSMEEATPPLPAPQDELEEEGSAPPPPPPPAPALHDRRTLEG